MQRMMIERGCDSLDVMVADDVDFDSRFSATCSETGQRLWINGWMIESMERIEA